IGTIVCFFFQAEDGIRAFHVTGVQTCALPISRLLGSDLAVAVTGVGGPGPEEEEAEGTVYIAVYTQSGVHAQRYQFEGEPAEVLDKTIFQALHLLRAALTA